MCWSGENLKTITWIGSTGGEAQHFSSTSPFCYIFEWCISTGNELWTSTSFRPHLTSEILLAFSNCCENHCQYTAYVSSSDFFFFKIFSNFAKSLWSWLIMLLMNLLTHIIINEIWWLEFFFFLMKKYQDKYNKHMHFLFMHALTVLKW